MSSLDSICSYGDWTEGGDELAVPPTVLLPGAGLGRLCVEVAGLGLQAQGNEFSYHMLLASSFMLNHCNETGQFQVRLFSYHFDIA